VKFYVPIAMQKNIIRREPITEVIEEGTDAFALVVTGTKAQELLDNETFKATVNELTAQITDQILSSPVNDPIMRQNLYMIYKALENLVRILKASASTKLLVQDQLLEESDEDVDLSNEINED
jgi:hypothetical protein